VTKIVHGRLFGVLTLPKSSTGTRGKSPEKFIKISPKKIIEKFPSEDVHFF